MRSAAICFAVTIGALAGGLPTPAEQAVSQAAGEIGSAPAKAVPYSRLAAAQIRRARETADLGFLEQAAGSVARSLDLDPDNFEARKVQAWLLVERHEFAAARDLARELNRQRPDDTRVYEILTDTNIELGNYKEAEEAAQWLLNIGRAGVSGLTRAARLRELFGDVAGALILVNSAYQRIPSTEIEERARTLMQAARLLLISGKQEAADRTSAQALKLVPGYPDALAQQARIRSAEGRHAESAGLFRARCGQTSDPQSLFDLASALERSGQAAEAAHVFDQFEKKAQAQSQTWMNANRELVAYYVDKGRAPEALRIAELESGRRQDVFTLDAYAWALLHNNRLDEARRQIETALAVGVRDPLILYHAAAIAKATGDDRAARRYASDSLRQDPRSEAAADAEKLLADGAALGRN